MIEVFPKLKFGIQVYKYKMELEMENPDNSFPI